MKHAVIGFIIGIAIMSTSKVLNPGSGYFDNLAPGLVGFCVMTFYLIKLQALKHSEKIKKGVYPRHWKANILRAIVLLAICCLIHAYAFDWIRVLRLAIFGLFWLGIVFNFSLNDYRGLPAFYTGKDDKRDALTDILFSKLKYGGEILFLLSAVAAIYMGYVYLG